MQEHVSLASEAGGPGQRIPWAPPRAAVAVERESRRQKRGARWLCGPRKQFQRPEKGPWRKKAKIPELGKKGGGVGMF